MEESKKQRRTEGDWFTLFRQGKWNYEQKAQKKNGKEKKNLGT